MSNPSLTTRPGSVTIRHEQSVPSCFRMPKGRPRHQPAEEVHKGVAFRDRGDEDVRKRGNFLHQPELRLARKSVQDEASSSHVLQLGPLARDLTPAAKNHSFLGSRWAKPVEAVEVCAAPTKTQQRGIPRRSKYDLARNDNRRRTAPWGTHVERRGRRQAPPLQEQRSEITERGP